MCVWINVSSEIMYCFVWCGVVGSAKGAEFFVHSLDERVALRPMCRMTSDGVVGNCEEGGLTVDAKRSWHWTLSGLPDHVLFVDFVAVGVCVSFRGSGFEEFAAPGPSRCDVEESEVICVAPFVYVNLYDVHVLTSVYFRSLAGADRFMTGSAIAFVAGAVARGEKFRDHGGFPGNVVWAEAFDHFVGAGMIGEM